MSSHELVYHWMNAILGWKMIELIMKSWSNEKRTITNTN